jgi:Type II CAAX prenyl endopeptidase Rce1-like
LTLYKILAPLGWWNGRHWGLKIPWGQPRAGSTPVPSNRASQRFYMPSVEIANQDKSKGLFLRLWLLCILGVWSLLPYQQHLGIVPSSVALSRLFLVATAQAIIFFGVVCWLSYLLLSKSDLLPFSTDKPLKRMIYPGVIAGFSIGFLIYLFEIMLFKSSSLSGIHPPAWTGFLASFYGGINEEILCRLFLFTFVYFLFRKIFRFEVRNRLIFLWMTNVVVAFVFGLSHFLAALKLTSPSSFEIFRLLLLNGIASMVFGWLYWSRGLWTAMFAHFAADLVLHVFIPCIA